MTLLSQKNKIWYPILLAIFTSALFLRLYRLDLNLPHIYSDETWHYFILGKLKNCTLSLQCLYQKAYFGTYSATWILGLTPLGVRLFSAIYGSLIPVFVFFFALSVSKKKSIALVSAFIASVAPWSYLISRFGHTQIPILVNLILLHLIFFLKKYSTRRLIISLIFLSSAVIYYQSMVVLFPFALALVGYNLFQHFGQKSRKKIFIGVLGLIFLVEIFAINRFSVLSAQERGLDLAIWRDPNTNAEFDKYRTLSGDTTVSKAIVYNRATASFLVFARNYFSFFSPDWLFLKGDSILRHSTGQVGAFFPFLAPFMLYGAFKFFQTADKKKKLTFLLWILVSPIPAAITKDGAGYLLRVVTMLPFLTYFCALGLVDSFGLIRKHLRFPYAILLLAIGFYSAYYFFYGYFHVYPALAARSHESGFKELANFQSSHNNASLLVIWEGFYHDKDFRFWQNTPFEKQRAFQMKRIDVGNSTIWQTYPNLYFSSPESVEDFKSFVSQYRPEYVVLSDRYFVKYPEEVEALLSPVSEVKYPDQTTAFRIFSPSMDKKAPPR